METVDARDLKQHTGEVIGRVSNGERLLLSVRGRPVAIIAPIAQESLDASMSREAQNAEEGWQAAAEDAFDFWDNEDDAVWDRVAVK